MSVLKPSELAEYRLQGAFPGKKWPEEPFEIEGYLIASGKWSHLIDNEQAEKSELCYGVIVPEQAIECLRKLNIPPMGGTFVEFTGQASFVCDVWHSGFPALPFGITQIYEFTYTDETVGTHRFKLLDIFRDLIVNIDDHLSPAQLKALKSLSKSKSSIMQLKQNLQPGTKILLGQDLSEASQQTAKSMLEAEGLDYVFKFNQRGNDWLADTIRIK